MNSSEQVEGSYIHEMSDQRSKDEFLEFYPAVTAQPAIENETAVNFSEMTLPTSFESAFVQAIFEMGLRQSSPKVLVPLLPHVTDLNTEHIKSHLQKYRIHHQRSKAEFLEFYNAELRDTLRAWELYSGKQGPYAPPANGQIIKQSSSSSNLVDRQAIEAHPPAEPNTGFPHQASSPVEVASARASVDAMIESVLALANQSNAILSNWKQCCNEVLEQIEKLKDTLTPFESTEEELRLLPVEPDTEKKATTALLVSRAV